MRKENSQVAEPRGGNTDESVRGGLYRSSVDMPCNGVGAKGAARFRISAKSTDTQEELRRNARPIAVSKHVVFEAYLDVKRNRGSNGVDGQSLQEFEEELKDNLYRIWNRLSSGSYFPPPVREVSIPKEGGKERKLGVPTVSDRIAQTVVKRYLEPMVEPMFHEDSYGYRPNKSAHDALRRARKRCWSHDWCIDLDIKGFFDNLDWTLSLKALEHVCKESWIILYIKRWLAAPIQKINGDLVFPTKGTAQGGVMSPLVANIFMHYAFDTWLTRECPSVHFERYADDGVPRTRRLRPESEGVEVML